MNFSKKFFRVNHKLELEPQNCIEKLNWTKLLLRPKSYFRKPTYLKFTADALILLLLAETANNLIRQFLTNQPPASLKSNKLFELSNILLHRCRLFGQGNFNIASAGGRDW